MMYKGRLALGCLLALALVAVGTILRHDQPLPIYSVAQVHAGLTRHTGAWVGRMVLVRGLPVTFYQQALPHSSTPRAPHLVVLVPGSPALSHDDALYDALTAGTSLLLRPQHTDPLTAALRHVPLVSRLVSPAQRADAAAPTVYRIQILPRLSCVRTQCYDALLPDFVP